MKINILSVILLLVLGGVITFFLTRPPKVETVTTEKTVYLTKLIHENHTAISNISITNSMLSNRKVLLEAELLRVMVGYPNFGIFTNYRTTVNNLDIGRIGVIRKYQTNEALYEQNVDALEVTIGDLRYESKRDKVLVYVFGGLALTGLGLALIESIKK